MTLLLQPYQGTDVVAFLLVLSGLLYFALWRRDQEPGMGWFALGMPLLAVWIVTSNAHLPTGPYLQGSWWIYLLASGLACLAIGLIDYLGVPPARRRAARWGTLLPVAVCTAMLALVTLGGARIPRTWFNPVVSLSFCVMGAVAWWAHRREPDAGHRFVALALWAVPAVTVALLLARADTVALRYWGALPVLCWR